MASASEWRAVRRNLEKDIEGVRKKARTTFVKEVYGLEAFIIKEFFSRTSQSGLKGLKARSGDARRAWKVTIKDSPGEITGRINNSSPYAASHLKDRTVRPKAGKQWLAIPSKHARTPAGVSRFKGPRDPKAPRMHFSRKKGDSQTAFLFGDFNQGRYANKLMFILKKKIFIPGRLEKLPGVAKQRVKFISKQVARAMAGV